MIGALARLRGALVVAVGGVAIFVAMHFVLGYALGVDAARIFPRQRPLGWPVYERVWSRVAAIDELYHNGQLPAKTRLGVCIGVSTTAAGIQRPYLDSRATAADRWIVLAAAGMSLENIESVTHPLFFCDLKPSIVVLGVHPQMLVGETFLGDEPKLEQRVVGRRQALESRFVALYPLRWLKEHWVVKHRTLAALYLRTHIYAARLCVFYLAGVRAEKLARPAAEPWDEDPLWLWNMDDLDNHIAEQQLKFWARRGHFDSENYDPDGAQARSLVRMILAFRRLGAKVEVILMPLRTSLREIVPANAKPCLFETLRRAFPNDPPKVIDLEDSIPDEFFTDQVHLSKGGAIRLSNMVADQLQAPPPESPATNSSANESPTTGQPATATTPDGS